MDFENQKKIMQSKMHLKKIIIMHFKNKKKIMRLRIYLKKILTMYFKNQKQNAIKNSFQNAALKCSIKIVYIMISFPSLVYKIGSVKYGRQRYVR